jgi:hypothetical protein
VPWLSDITGSREDFWLQALVSAFRVSGYCSGVVTDFSIRQPITRISLAVKFCGSISVSLSFGIRFRKGK